MYSKTLSFCIVLTFCCWKSKIYAVKGCCSYSKTSYCKGSVLLKNINISMSAKPLVNRLEFIHESGQDSFANNSLGNYTELKIVYLQNNKIKRIQANLFQNNQKLEEINLGHNQITDIPPTLFNNAPDLQILWLNDNQLKNISDNVFEKNGALKALIINGNQISTFTTDFFQRISNLETLNVENNKLKFFNPEFFTKISTLEIFYTSGFSDCCSAEKRVTNINCVYNNPKGPVQSCGVRIVKNDEKEYIGRVEINDGGLKWKTICDKHWTKEDAITVCRELGYDGSAEPMLPKYVHKVNNDEAKLSNEILDCKGHEYSTIGCARKNQTDCGSSYTPVGVRCQETEKHACEEGHACSCKNSTIDCSRKALKYTPWIENDKSENITELDLSNNRITWIFVHFLRTFHKLEKIDFSSNEISEIPETLLSNCTALKEINFAGNKISAIPKNLLNNQRQLNKVDLSSNVIKELPPGVFVHTGKLNQLILQGNQFTKLPAYYFIGLKNLELLDVSKMTTTLARKIEWQPIFDNLQNLKILKTSYFSHCCFAALLQKNLDCDAPADAFSSCERMLKTDVLRYLMWVFAVLTFSGNIFALIMRLTETDENRVQNLLVSSLCVSDMLMGVYLVGIIDKEISTLGSYYKYDLEWRSSSSCHTFGAFSVISSEVSVFTLVIIAYDRFLHVVRALDFKEINYPTAVTMLALTWTTCTIIAVIPSVVTPYFNDKILNTGFYGTSSICLPLQLPGERATAWEYCLTIFGVLNFVAAMYLIVAYIRMFYSSYKSAREAGNSIRMNDHPKMATRFATIVFTDVCCWVPIAMLLFLSLGRAVTDADNTLYAYFSICIIPINSAINPILYTVGTPFFWRKITAYFKKISCCCKKGGDAPNVPKTNLGFRKNEKQLTGGDKPNVPKTNLELKQNEKQLTGGDKPNVPKTNLELKQNEKQLTGISKA